MTNTVEAEGTIEKYEGWKAGPLLPRYREMMELFISGIRDPNADVGIYPTKEEQ